MNSLEIALAVVAAVVVTPFVGGLLYGLDRKLTARLQGRVGPPVQQPFYDIVKLFSKRQLTTTRPQLVFVYGYLTLIMAAVILFALRQDLLVVVLVLGAAGVLLVSSGFSTRSPYSYIGSNRELLQMLAYEPILILTAVAIYIKTGSFLISEVSSPLLPSLWLVYIAFLVALVIMMRKSPFDISASHHAHQEIVRGVFTEFSGRSLGLIELAHWYELALVLGIVSLFWLPGVWPGILLALFSWFIVIVIDNITARLTWSVMLRASWVIGIILPIANIARLRLVGG
jgi:ech hydrogenase subunit B